MGERIYGSDYMDNAVEENYKLYVSLKPGRHCKRNHRTPKPPLKVLILHVYVPERPMSISPTNARHIQCSYKPESVDSVPAEHPNQS